MNFHFAYKLLLSATLGVAALLPSASALAQDYPSRNITMVMPYAAGGPGDIITRLFASAMQKQLGQTIVVDNPAGAGGSIGTAKVARSAPDGYTLFMGAVHHSIAPSMYPKLDYDLQKDFVPLALVANVPQVLVVNPKNVPGDFKAFLAQVRQNPGRLNYGSAGGGTSHHLAGELFKLQTQTFITHIPYRGTGPQLADLLAGRTHASSAGLPALGAHIRAGKLRAIAVGTQQRISGLPDIPTVAEMGFKDFETAQWYGILVPAGTPADVVKKIQEESLKALKSSAVTERFATDNAVGGGGPPSEFAAYIAKEQKIWSRIVKDAQIRAD